MNSRTTTNLDALLRAPARFGAVLADPPWRFLTWSARGRGRSPDRHYSDMSLDGIKALPVAELALPDAWLFLWTTGPHLRASFDVMEAWGFRYSSSGFVWIKTKAAHTGPVNAESDLAFGLGMTTRKGAEFVLLGRRGKPKRLSMNVREVMIEAVGRHSEKPAETHRRIETFCAGPYLELFARQARRGWTCWGDELHGGPARLDAAQGRQAACLAEAEEGAAGA